MDPAFRTVGVPDKLFRCHLILLFSSLHSYPTPFPILKNKIKYKEKIREGTKGRAILRNLSKKEFRETNKQIKIHTALPHVNPIHTVLFPTDSTFGFYPSYMFRLQT